MSQQKRLEHYEKLFEQQRLMINELQKMSTKHKVRIACLETELNSFKQHKIDFPDYRNN